MKHSNKLIFYAKVRQINDVFISIRIFLTFETNVFYINNVLIDKLNFKFVKSINLTNVHLAKKSYMLNNKQTCCKF